MAKSKEFSMATDFFDSNQDLTPMLSGASTISIKQYHWIGSRDYP